jgi:hypothetical protein
VHQSWPGTCAYAAPCRRSSAPGFLSKWTEMIDVFEIVSIADHFGLLRWACVWVRASKHAHSTDMYLFRCGCGLRSVRTRSRYALPIFSCSTCGSFVYFSTTRTLHSHTTSSEDESTTRTLHSHTTSSEDEKARTIDAVDGPTRAGLSG